MLDTHLHQFLATAMTLDIGSKEHYDNHHHSNTYYNNRLLKVVVGFQLHVFFGLFLIVVESVGLGDGLVVGNKVQLIVQILVTCEMILGLGSFALLDSDMSQNLMHITLTYRVALFHHSLTKIECRINPASVVIYAC